MRRKYKRGSHEAMREGGSEFMSTEMLAEAVNVDPTEEMLDALEEICEGVQKMVNPKYRYEVIEAGVSESGNDLIDKMNDLGYKGWEFVYGFQGRNFMDKKHYLVFKKRDE